MRGAAGKGKPVPGQSRCRGLYGPGVSVIAEYNADHAAPRILSLSRSRRVKRILASVQEHSARASTPVRAQNRPPKYRHKADITVVFLFIFSSFMEP
jgi:hypothetical protein